MSETDDPRRFYVANDGAVWMTVQPSIHDVLKTLAACDFGSDIIAIDGSDRIGLTEVGITEISHAKAMTQRVRDENGAPLQFGDAKMGELFCSEGP